MLILIIFAFIAGLVTILSPCILPVLPIVLSQSVSTGKRKPLGIVVGFILSFTFFTLFLSTLVKLTGIPADILRVFSVIIVFIFGISLLIPKFQLLSEQLFSRLTALVPKSGSRQDFIGGVLLGVSLGLLWTPCVGPILASVITLAATSSVTSASFFITLAYSLGTAIPMLLLIFGGQVIIRKLPFLQTKTQSLQKAFGILMIIIAVAIYYNYDRKFQTFVLDHFPEYGVGLTRLEDNVLVRKELNKIQSDQEIDSTIQSSREQLRDQSYPQAPELVPGGEWINSTPLAIEQLKGKVVLVDFWTYTCINCIRTLPYLKAWDQKYRDDGLIIIGVHTPEFEFEKNINNVKKAVKDFALLYPIVQDNDYATWQAYQNHYWPAKYLIDRNGRIRYSHFGEGAYDETEKQIQNLLQEITPSVYLEKIDNPVYTVTTQTPEIYLGKARLEAQRTKQTVDLNNSKMYSPQNQKPLSNTFDWDGSVLIANEFANPQAGARLRINYNSKDVFLVMRSKSGQSKIKLYLDDRPDFKQLGGDSSDGTVTVSADRLYHLIRSGTIENHILTIEFLDDRTEAFAFTFG